MDLTRFFDLLSEYSWQGIAVLGVLLAQAAIWVGLLRLHLAIAREGAPWDECVGKIRSAQTRARGGERELASLRARGYAPLVDRLISLHLDGPDIEMFERWLVLRWKIKEGLRPFWIRWGHLLIGFGIVVWCMYGLQTDIGPEPLKRTPADPRLMWVWLGYAMLVAWRLVGLRGGLERVQRALLVPERDE